MEKIKLNDKIVDALGLTVNERAVFDVLLATQMAITAARLANKSGVPRTTVVRVLRKLDERRLVVWVKHGARIYWRYKKGLEFYERVSINEMIERKKKVRSDEEIEGPNKDLF